MLMLLSMPGFRNTLQVFLLFPFCGLSRAGNIPLNGTCNPASTRADPATYKMISDCDDKLFCDNGICQWKRCRIFPQDTAYAPGDPVPPLCTQGTYCPDTQDTCKPLVPLGSSCELDRDDQCAPAPGSNLHNETMCIQYMCKLATHVHGESCITEDTPYSALNSAGKLVSIRVTRDDCKRPEYFCDRSMLACQPTKSIGVSCEEDRECISKRCSAAKTCTLSFGASQSPGPLFYSITITTVVTLIITLVASLVYIHKRQRAERLRERAEYYWEQINLRESISYVRAADPVHVKLRPS